MVDVSKWTVTKDWENPAIYERNRARMHVPLRSHKSKDAALRYYTDGPSRTEKPRIADLNSTTGDWKFALFDKPEDVVPNFWEPDFEDQPWSSVRLLFSLMSGLHCLINSDASTIGRRFKVVHARLRASISLRI